MKVTPLDIRRKEFKRSMRGYADEEVDIFLDEVADEFERLFQENIEMQEKLQRLEEQLESNAQIKDALEKTLVSAQIQADKLTANARKESELIMRDAELKARNIISESYSETQKVQQALVQLKHLEEDFRFKFRSLLEAHLRLLNEASLRPEPVLRSGAEEAAPQPVLTPVQVSGGELSERDEAAELAQVSAIEDPAETENKPKVKDKIPADSDEPPLKDDATAKESPVKVGQRAEAWPAADAVAALGEDEVPTEESAAPEVARVSGAEGAPVPPPGVARRIVPPPQDEKVDAPVRISDAALEPEDGGEELMDVKGFFFGKRLGDLDDSFVTFETPPLKDDSRDFQW